MKKLLPLELNQSPFSKAIRCSNAEKSTSELQDGIRLWVLDTSAFVHDTTVFVVGRSKETKHKELLAFNFTTQWGDRVIKSEVVRIFFRKHCEKIVADWHPIRRNMLHHAQTTMISQ